MRQNASLGKCYQVLQAVGTRGDMIPPAAGELENHMTWNSFPQLPAAKKFMSLDWTKHRVGDCKTSERIKHRTCM